MDGIAFAQSVRPALACPPARPVTQWGLPMPEVSLPPGYQLCVWKTTAVELDTDLIAGDDEAKPGIYMLQALPEQLSSRSSH